MCARSPARALCLLLALAQLGVASPDPARVAIQQALDAAREVVNGEGTRDVKLDALRALVGDMLDTRAMGRRAMGDVLAAQPEEQQQEYLDLFDHVIIRAYLQKLLLFRNPRFGYRESRRDNGVLLVRTKIITSKDEFYIDYEMGQREGRWLATDVIVEGISLSDNYHEQFSSLLRGRSFEELLELMRRKTRTLREEPA